LLALKLQQYPRQCDATAIVCGIAVSNCMASGEHAAANRSQLDGNKHYMPVQLHAVLVRSHHSARLAPNCRLV